MTTNQFNIHEGYNQMNPYAGQAAQNISITQINPTDVPSATQCVVILGAGVDAALGLPASNSLIPRIAEWLNTDEGAVIDKVLRGRLKRLTFSYDTLIDKKINSLICDLDHEREAICRHIDEELQHNGHLDEQSRKLGSVIVRLFQKITDVKNNALIDEETGTLIHELFGIELSDPSIIDITKISYTKGFESIFKEILKRSMNNADNPVLRHVYKNMLDIEKLLRDHFYGFYTGKESEIKAYLYIAWTLWAYLVHEEQAALARHAETGDPLPVYGQLEGKKLQVVTFNYTTMAATASPSALYFNGNLTDYVDIETKNENQVNEIPNLDIVDFFQSRLSVEMNLEGEYKNIPVPTFMPPLKLKPVISKQYITTWYKTYEAIRRASHILILGHSLQASDGFFSELLRDNPTAEIVIVDRDLDRTCSRLCTMLQQDARRYSPATIQRFEARRYNNRITVVGADLREIDLQEWLG